MPARLPGCMARVTPVEMERFSNGVRLLFRPPESSYLSKKEEQEQLRQTQLQSERETGGGKGAARRGAYKTPEQVFPYSIEYLGDLDCLSRII